MKRKGLSILLVLALLVFAIPAHALQAPPVVYEGYRISTEAEQIYATGSWDDPAGWFRIAWDIDAVAGGYTYTYTISWASKDLSHLILGVSQNFTSGNISGSEYDSIGWFSPTDPGKSNPGLPQAIYGIKFDYYDGLYEGNSVQYSFFSDRAPMWGSFYAKDGQDANGTIDVYAYNWGLKEGLAIPDGTFNTAWYIVVPNTHSVPEPGTLLLLGIGLLGIGLTRRK